MAQLTWLPGLPVDLITAAYARAPGNEIASGKILSAESSSALVANTFGYFLRRPQVLPPLPGCGDLGWPVVALTLEMLVRFPWSGGRHPCLDAVAETKASVIGIESKRYEPFRSHSSADLSDAYWRPLWGAKMGRYEQVRDDLKNGKLLFRHLDAAQLIKHAFGLRTSVQPGKAYAGKRPVLFYLFAEPSAWPDGPPIPAASLQCHLDEIGEFAARTAGGEVDFRYCSYSELLQSWAQAEDVGLIAHAKAVAERFAP